MNELNEKIKELYSLLSTEQLQQDIIELDSDIGNKKIIDFLEKTGPVEIKYEIKSDYRPGRIQEKGGCTNLWYKKSDGTWIIKLWEVNRLKAHNNVYKK